MKITVLDPGLPQTISNKERDDKRPHQIGIGTSGKAIVVARLREVGCVVISHTSSGWKEYRRGSATPVIKQLCKCCCAHGKRNVRKAAESEGFWWTLEA